MPFNELLKQISFETFFEIISTSPRKVREALYSHYSIKSKSRFGFSATKEKKEEKIRKLLQKLINVSSEKEHEFLKELFRNWLFHKRAMLKSALDFLKVENDNGLVEIETDFFQDLDKKTVADLIAHLQPDFPKDDILIYLTFMEVPHIDSLFQS